jgi:Na+/proline symporter
MRALDWIVLFGWLSFIVSYGLWRGRGSGTTNKYLLAGKSMPWYAMGLSIMATQASAITFISTTGQSYIDGMRFVQFYFGLPLAMVILSATAVPIFHRANVYTAYEYLERRFDAKTRAAVTVVFLIQRGLASGISLCAPAVVLSVILDWPARTTILLMGGLVIIYTAMGGIKAVTWTDVLQMSMILAALVLAFGIAVSLLPRSLSFHDALTVAGAAGRLNVVDFHFDPDNRYNVWSGLIGGTFLFLSYFGTDQSQVQRYLTGKSIGQSRLSLLMNAMAKIPMQFFILLIGAMVFVFFTFVRPPLLFDPVGLKNVQATAAYRDLQSTYNDAYEQRREAANGLVAARHAHDHTAFERNVGLYRAAQQRMNVVHAEAARTAEAASGASGFGDSNYVFLSFVTHYLPVGVVGLVIGVIFSAAMSSISGEINSLATVSIIDIYRRYAKRDAPDHHYVVASRVATVFWGLYAIVFASYKPTFGALIEAVNMIGSLFYGTMLGAFALAFFFKRVRGNGAFYGVIVGQAAIFAFHFGTRVSYLWYNVIGCVVVVGVALLISTFDTGGRDVAVERRSTEAG